MQIILRIILKGFVYIMKKLKLNPFWTIMLLMTAIFLLIVSLDFMPGHESNWQPKPTCTCNCETCIANSR